jgi:polar amino acid transport system substrate-binding protein
MRSATSRLIAALFVLAAVLALPAAAFADTLSAVQQRGELVWGTDLEGGAPFVVADPNHPNEPNKTSGFETEIGHAIARELGVKGKIQHIAWDGLIPALARKNFDIAFNGLEVTPDRQGEVLFSRPYYVYTHQIVVRKGTTGIDALQDLRGKRVGVLGSTVAERLLQGVGDVNIKIYPSSVQPYDDLLVGRLDAVLQDLPIAVAYGRREGMAFAGKPFGEGLYAIAFRKEDQTLKAAVDGAIGRLLVSGELERILRSYDLWNSAQARLAQPEDQVLAQTQSAPTVAPKTFWAQLWNAAPLLAQGTLMTITVYSLGMLLAITLGIGLAVAWVYGGKPVQFLAAGYVEVFRGTPLLIQLFLIYYGLPNLGIQLDAFVAAVVGLGLNYAAYEAENYRAGLLAVPRGQIEAAMALGLDRWQMLREIVFPQAFRIVIPPVTNDFIALFKDSSVVSVITLVELTKAYGMMASATYNYMGFGLVAAAIYFSISYPTSLFARYIERRLKVA